MNDVIKTNFKRDRSDGMSDAYLAKIRKLPSCISWQMPCEAHHLRSGPAARERGVGRKATDKWALPLTPEEHSQCHHYGSKREIAWFRSKGIHAHSLAKELWANRHNQMAMYRVLMDHFHDPRRWHDGRIRRHP